MLPDCWQSRRDNRHEKDEVSLGDWSLSRDDSLDPLHPLLFLPRDVFTLRSVVATPLPPVFPPSRTCLAIVTRGRSATATPLPPPSTLPELSSAVPSFIHSFAISLLSPATFQSPRRCVCNHLCIVYPPSRFTVFQTGKRDLEVLEISPTKPSSRERALNRRDFMPGK